MLSAAAVSPKPSWANPFVASNDVALSEVNVAVRVVALVTTADAKSEVANVTPALLELASRSQTNFDQSKLDFTSVSVAANVLNFVPVIIISRASVVAFLP